MNHRQVLGLLVSPALAVTALTVTAVTAEPASADLWGPPAYTGASPDGYWDEATSDVLGYGHVTQGHLVGLWQSFLRNYNQVPICGVDGRWGSTTANGTANVQNFFGIYPDGVVGDQTWHAASTFLYYYGTTYAGTGQIKRYFTGAFSQVLLGGGYYYQNVGEPFGGYWFWDSPYITKWYLQPVNSSSGPDLTFAPLNPLGLLC